MNLITADDLDKQNAYTHIQDARYQLDMMTWYLQAKAVDDFFKRWPEVNTVWVETTYYDPVNLQVMEDKFFDGKEETLSKDRRAKLGEDLMVLSSEMTLMVPDSGRVTPLIGSLLSVRYLSSDCVIEQFRHIWGNHSPWADCDKAIARWDMLMVELGARRLDDGVDDAQDATTRPTPRM